jgi:hypothetical protein
MIRRDSASALFVDTSFHAIADSELTMLEPNFVNHDAANWRVRIGDTGDAGRRCNRSDVADLTSGLGVERRLIKDDLAFAIHFVE